MRKLRVGDEVRIEFLDHCKHSSLPSPGALGFYVYGKIVEDTSLCYVVGCWVSTTKGDVDNIEAFTVLKSTIKQIKRIKY